MKQTIGIIGYGNMGSAIAERIKALCIVHVFDKDPGKLTGVIGPRVCEDAQSLIHNSDVVILAVKPQDMREVLSILRENLTTQTVISIAAGITLDYLRTQLPQARLIRVMPNLAARIGLAVTGICFSAEASIEGRQVAEQLFKKIGDTLVVPESLMDALTAVSGSGPGFLFSLLEHQPRETWEKYTEDVFSVYLREAAVKLGFSEEDAGLLAGQTARGALALLEATEESPAVLREQVTSKGGTTDAGLKVLAGDVHNLDAAVKAACERSRELSL